MMKVSISHPEQFERIKSQIRQQGFERLHVVSDFDRTLTYGSVNGFKIPSIISLLRDGKHLTEGYAEKAHALFDTYHPKEVDPTLDLHKKKNAMHEWWAKHYELLIESGLSFNDLRHIVDTGFLQFRDGVGSLLDFLHAHTIPIVIFSSSGCGEAIPLFFQKNGKDYSNIIYVINRFEWDESGRAIGVKESIIHSYNKDETALNTIPEAQAAILGRPNVLLLGDGVGDADMIDERNCGAVIKIGFLNSEYDHDRELFKKNFDVVLEGDGDVAFVNKLIGELMCE